MKLSERYRLDSLADDRRQLLTQRGIVVEDKGGLGVTIQGSYQAQAFIDAVRPSVLKVIDLTIAQVDEELRALGVEVDG